MKVERLNTASKSPQVNILKVEISWLATDWTITHVCGECFKHKLIIESLLLEILHTVNLHM